VIYFPKGWEDFFQRLDLSPHCGRKCFLYFKKKWMQGMAKRAQRAAGGGRAKEDRAEF